MRCYFCLQKQSSIEISLENSISGEWLFLIASIHYSRATIKSQNIENEFPKLVGSTSTRNCTVVHLWPTVIIFICHSVTSVTCHQSLFRDGRNRIIKSFHPHNQQLLNNLLICLEYKFVEFVSLIFWKTSPQA